MDLCPQHSKRTTDFGRGASGQGFLVWFFVAGNRQQKYNRRERHKGIMFAAGAKKNCF
jgi:hypothetical protein